MCIWYCTTLHAPLVLCRMPLYTCMATHLNLPDSWSNFPFLFVVACLSPSFYQNKWGCIKHCWCPVRWTNYGAPPQLLWQPLSDNPLIFLKLSCSESATQWCLCCYGSMFVLAWCSFSYMHAYCKPFSLVLIVKGNFHRQSYSQATTAELSDTFG